MLPAAIDLCTWRYSDRDTVCGPAYILGQSSHGAAHYRDGKRSASLVSADKQTRYGHISFLGPRQLIS